MSSVMQDPNASNDPNDWTWWPFEGIDWRTKRPYCRGCCCNFAGILLLLQKPAFKPVKTCSGCKLVYYCSRECQVNDRASHKRACKTIQKQRELVQREEHKARAAGYFESHVGDFWQVAFPYIKARYDLALLIHPAAYQSNILDNWQEMNAHFQGIIRLINKHDGNDYGITMKFPMFLLHEGRDDDAYAFLRYSAHRWHSSSDVDPALYKVQDETKEGDFIWPREENCRYNDFFVDCPNLVDEFQDIHILVVLWLIKKRLLCICASREHAFQEFVGTESGQSLFGRNHDVGYTVLSFLTVYNIDNPGEGRHWVVSQNEQLNEISRRIDALNPNVLPSFRNPTAFLQARPEPPPRDEMMYGMGQVWAILNDCNKHLEMLPGLAEWVDQWMEQNRG